MESRQLHVVFGAGQIGTPLARRLRAEGHDVRLVRRSKAPAGDEIHAVSGDAGDPVFAADVTREAHAIYHCMNPPYDSAVWARELPRLMSSLLEAAGRNHSRLVVLDNLYMFGRMGGQPMNEDTPAAPCSRKGEIRAAVAAQWLEAHRAGRAKVVSGRASDYYGPGGLLTHFGDPFWRRVMAGKSAQMVVPVDSVHTFHLTTDVAAALATLGAAADEDYGRWWMLPAAQPLTARALIAEFGSALGRPIRVERVPGFVVGGMSVFMPFLRELPEMRYQWEEPYRIDDTRFRTRFGVTPTSIKDGARATVKWAGQTFGQQG